MPMMSTVALTVAIASLGARRPRCPGWAPVTWHSPQECVEDETACGGSDWNASHPAMVPRCSDGGTLRHFGRAATMRCLGRLNASGRSRVLFAGVSNMMHIFMAMQNDDSDEPCDVVLDEKAEAHPLCKHKDKLCPKFCFYCVTRFVVR